MNYYTWDEILVQVIQTTHCAEKNDCWSVLILLDSNWRHVSAEPVSCPCSRAVDIPSSLSSYPVRCGIKPAYSYIITHKYLNRSRGEEFSSKEQLNHKAAADNAAGLTAKGDLDAKALFLSRPSAPQLSFIKFACCSGSKVFICHG